MDKFEKATSGYYMLLLPGKPAAAIKFLYSTADKSKDYFFRDMTNALVSFKAALQLDPENINIKKTIGGITLRNRN